MPTSDHRLFLTNTKTGEVRALDESAARVLRREMWPTELYSNRHVWRQTDDFRRAHLIATDPDGHSWSVEEVEEATQSAHLATVARICERGFDYRPDLAA